MWKQVQLVPPMLLFFIFTYFCQCLIKNLPDKQFSYKLCSHRFYSWFSFKLNFTIQSAEISIVILY